MIIEWRSSLSDRIVRPSALVYNQISSFEQKKAEPMVGSTTCMPILQNFHTHNLTKLNKPDIMVLRNITK